MTYPSEGDTKYDSLDQLAYWMQHSGSRDPMYYVLAGDDVIVWACSHAQSMEPVGGDGQHAWKTIPLGPMVWVSKGCTTLSERSYLPEDAEDIKAMIGEVIAEATEKLESGV